MEGHRVDIMQDGRSIETLNDILPDEPGLRILFVAKTPAPVSVNAGHYFQGKQGTMFWNKLEEYGILRVPNGEFHDDHLLANGYGLTDIVKVPRTYGDEPTAEEYRNGVDRILDLVRRHEPKVVVFVYKRVLDTILQVKFRRQEKSKYGFNQDVETQFGTRVFVFPMPGTPCTKEVAQSAMEELARLMAD